MIYHNVVLYVEFKIPGLVCQALFRKSTGIYRRMGMEKDCRVIKNPGMLKHFHKEIEGKREGAVLNRY